MDIFLFYQLKIEERLQVEDKWNIRNISTSHS